MTTVGVFVNEIMADDATNRGRRRGCRWCSCTATRRAERTPALQRAGRAVDDARRRWHRGVAAWPSDTTFLLDAADPVQRGGPVSTVDWASAAARLPPRRRVILAGGLTAVNVAEAIDAVRPYGVDVSSGVEETPGVKNPVKVAAFLANARAAFERNEAG